MGNDIKENSKDFNKTIDTGASIICIGSILLIILILALIVKAMREILQKKEENYRNKLSKYFKNTVVIILVIASIYYLAGRRANKLSEETRDIQNVFFNFINDLVDGFKELILNKMKRIDYSFKTEEIVFITGGNGSGKSSLAKVLVFLLARKRDWHY